MHGVNLSNAIKALRFRAKSRRLGDKNQLVQAELEVKAQAPYAAQVQQALINNSERMTLSKVTPGWVKSQLKKKKQIGYQLLNPLETESSLLIQNLSRETSHPIEPAMYVQLKSEEIFGVRLSAKRLGQILVQLYGYKVIETAETVEQVDVREAREHVEVKDVSENSSLDRDGLIKAIRQSIPHDVITLDERLQKKVS
ncbi:hypothetical protein [Vibrio azureus]|uniref:Uncharacterized protein n=1 Tax=Vibrio azureus NBRC 104587 TaxID=1219077 RepID=U3ASK6_9VIBR|nr:hypothetical protein [Vibrio azureus]GAD76232.1 hypothetical protein VAZ01S_039_00570 [Vibrio azureus NBRC 104587]